MPRYSIHRRAEPSGKTARATHSEARGALVVGSLYRGKVMSSSSAHGTYNVDVGGMGVLQGCMWGAGLFSTLFGFRTNMLLPAGSGVLVLFGSPPVIIGTLPSDPPDLEHGSDRTVTGITNQEQVRDAFDGWNTSASSEVHRAQTFGSDLVEGEFEITNYMGVALAMLTSMAKLSAGDRASVEVHMFNDMVRILSDTFRHHSAFGDMQIYNDGRLNVRFDGTSYDHEAWGVEDAKAPKLPGVAGSKVPLEDMQRTREAGRWRISHFLGFLGDFMHTFITDPGEVALDSLVPAVRAGKAHLHVNMDGSIIAQSVADIVLERVCRITVPKPLKHQDDAEGNTPEDMNSLEEKFLKIWNYGQNFKDAWQTTFQIREYARWLNTFHSYSRFLQMNKDWELLPEAEQPVPSYNSAEADKAGATSGQPDSYDTYATIRIMRDGTVMTWDGCGGCIVTGNGNGYVCVPRHLHLEAGGDIRMTAGQNIFMKARRSVEITAVRGGMILKARTWFRGLCEWGSMWLKSDAVDPNAPDVEIPEVESPDDPAPEILSQAIVLDASNGRTMVRSERGAALEVHAEPDDAEDPSDTSGAVLIQSRRGGMLVRTRGDITLKSENPDAMVALSAGKVLLHARKVIGEVAEFFSIGRKFTYWVRKLSKNPKDSAAEELHVSRVRAQELTASQSIKGPERAGFGPKEHVNHIDKINPASLKNLMAAGDEDKDGALSRAKAAGKFDTALKDKALTWKFEQPGEYLWGERARDDSHLMQSLAQQHIVSKSDAQVDTDTAYGDWTWAEDGLKEAPRTAADSLPYPGKGAMHYEHPAEDKLTVPSEEAPAEHDEKGTPLKASEIVLKYLKKP